MFDFLRKNKKKNKQIVPENKKVVPQNKAQEMTNNEVLTAINQMQKELNRLKLAVTGGIAHEVTENGQITTQALQDLQNRPQTIVKNENEKVIEGVFDGQNMVGADGRQYDVPANYASKSKLVEGDILKLTINNLGAFVYKQIKPIERKRIVGLLEFDDQDKQFYAVAEGKKWRLLTASVTYFKGEAGDEVVFLIPEDGGSRWAAVENIVTE